MPEPFTMMAANMIGQGASAALGIGLANLNDRRQLAQQEKLQALQIKGNKEMSDYNYQKQLEMWEKTNYSAQKEQMKKAGLNPGLMYGMGGGGGTTTGSAGGGVSGSNAPAGGGEIMGLMLGLEKMKAEVALTKAQAENVQADTQNKSKEGANIEASTASLLQGVENSKAQERLTKLQGDLAEYEKHIKGETLEASVAMAKYQTNIALQQLNILRNEAIISENTWSDKIEIVQQELAGSIARNELTRAQITKTEEETAQLAKQIALEYAKLANEKDKTVIQRKLQEFETSFGGQAANILGTIVNNLPGKGKGAGGFGQGGTVNNYYNRQPVKLTKKQ